MTNREKWLEWAINTLREAAWAPVGVFLLYRLGLVLQLFNAFPVLDVPTHFAGGLAITYFFRVAIRHSQKLAGEIPFPIQVLFAFTCAGTTAVFWEFYEFMSDRFFDTRMIRSVRDTIVDLGMGVLGALIVSLSYRRR